MLMLSGPIVDLPGQSFRSANRRLSGMMMWCVVPRAGIEPARSFEGAADFKSAVSTNFTIEACAHCTASRQAAATANKKGSPQASLVLERETSLELATSTLARLRS